MGNLFYVIAIILILGWGIGYIGYNVGGIIHGLLIMAVIAVLLRLIQEERIV